MAQRLLYGTITAGRIVEAATENTLTDSTLIKSGAGVLTLSAAGAYTLTVPANGTVALGTGTAGRVTQWATASTLGDSTLIKDGANLFTIRAVGTLNYFIGATGNLTLSGDSNMAMGSGVMTSITSGAGNVGIGVNSLLAVQDGGGNMAIGTNSLLSLTSGSSNVAIGASAGRSIVSTSSNTYIGNNCGFYFTGTLNVAIGTGAMQGANGLSTSNSNTAIGVNSMNGLQSGGENVAVGFESGRSLSPGNQVTTGTRNTFIGTYTGPSTSTQLTNTTAIGYRAFVGASNTVVLGGTGTLLQDGVIGATTASAHWDVVGGADKVQLRAIGHTTQTNPVAQLIDLTAATNATREVLRLESRTTGTAADGFGPQVSMYGESASADTYRQMAAFDAVWATATDATRKAKIQLSAYDTSKRLGVTIEADGSQALTKIGDGVTNYSQFDGAGHLTMVGTATVFDDLRIEPVARTTGTNAPTFEKWYDDAAGTSRGVYLYSFANESVASNEDEVFFSMQMPHSWAGTAISMHVHWVGASTVNASDVIWGMEYNWKDIGEVFGDTVIVTSSATLVPDDANITANKHYISEFADLTPGTTADGISSILIGRLFRNSSNAGDNYTDKVGLLYIDAHIEINSLGSNSEYVK